MTGSFDFPHYKKKQPFADVLKNFATFTEKYLSWNFFLIKLQACNFIKKRL